MIMNIDLLIFVLLAINTLLLIVVLVKLLREKSTKEELNREEFNRQMAANRSEISHTMNSQFRAVFEMLRATSKDQNESLKDFGLLFRENVREFNELQREKFSELSLRQERMLLST